jgi:hypothetical protein
MQIQLKNPVPGIQMPSRPAVVSTAQDKSSLQSTPLQFGFFKLKPKELLMAGFFIGLEKSARLLNIVTFGKYGLKKGEKLKFTIL